MLFAVCEALKINIGGLQVAMENALVVGEGQRAENLLHHLDACPWGRLFRKPDVEAAPFESLHHKVGRAFVNPVVGEPDDVGVRELAQNTRLALETPLHERGCFGSSSEEFQGHEVLKTEVARLVHDADAACAKNALDPVTRIDDCAKHRVIELPHRKRLSNPTGRSVAFTRFRDRRRHPTNLTRAPADALGWCTHRKGSKL